MAIRTAKAIVEEVPQVAASSVGSLATIREDHSERDTHATAKRYGLTLPIPLDEISVGHEVVPFIRMTSWAKFILSHNLWHRLCGLSEPDEARSATMWKSFWGRYKEINPGHSIFQRPHHDFSKTCALMLHGDEGRSLRKSPLMVISVHSIMGFGLSTSKKKVREHPLAQKLNYKQPTWTTRFLLSVLPKQYYSEDDENDFGDTDPFQDLMGGISSDLRSLYDDGIQTPDGQFFFCVINVMGDWPFIAKCGNLTRSYLNISKAASSKSAPKGICHLCKADMTWVIWENFESDPPTWSNTINTLNAFETVPAVLQLAHDESFAENFFQFDLFHAFHLGCGKTFLASCIAVLCLSNAYEGGVDLRLESVTADFKSWSQETGFRCQLRKINKAKLGWLSMTTYPSGCWSKGSTTTCLMKFFLAMCDKHHASIQDDLLLQLAHRAAAHADSFLRQIYRWELWIPKDAAIAITVEGDAFLRLHGKVVQLAHSRGKLFFLLMPNYHRIHHIIWEMKCQAQRSKWIMNPLFASTQSDEDYIGRPSRISRRVSPRLTIKRTLERSLLAAYAQYVKIGVLILDAKKNRTC